MAELFLISPHHPFKILKSLKKQIAKQGLDCEVLSSPIEALIKVKECFGIKQKRLPNLKLIDCGPFKLKQSNYTIIQNGQTKKLRKKHFELLQFFIANKNQILSRFTILENVWGPKANPFSNTVDVHIAGLRKIINTKENTYLKTVHTAGYILEI